MKAKNKKKLPYLTRFSSKCKIKDSLFCPTFKVEEIKWSYFFHFELKWARYGHFVDFKILIWNPKVVKNKNGYISLILAQNEIIRTHYFLQEKKVVLFFSFWAKLSKIWPLFKLRVGVSMGRFVCLSVCLSVCPQKKCWYFV